MPTNKPRVTITFNPQVYETLHRLAELQGVSMSRVVGDLLEAVHPPLMRTAALLEAALEAPTQVREGLARTVEDMERELAGALGSGVAQMDWLLSKLGNGSSAGEPSPASGRGRSTRGGARPPRSNTGVRSGTGTESKGPKPKRGKGSRGAAARRGKRG